MLWDPLRLQEVLKTLAQQLQMTNRDISTQRGRNSGLYKRRRELSFQSLHTGLRYNAHNLVCRFELTLNDFQLLLNHFTLLVSQIAFLFLQLNWIWLSKWNHVSRPKLLKRISGKHDGKKKKKMFYEHLCFCQEVFVVSFVYVAAAFVSLCRSFKSLEIPLVVVLVCYERYSSGGSPWFYRWVNRGPEKPRGL